MIRARRRTRAELAKRKQLRDAKHLGPTKRQQKATKDAHEHAVIAAVRAAVWQRSLRDGDPNGFCDLCGFGFDCYSEGEMNETPSRAKTRGMRPEQRFNLSICCRAHRQCHADLHLGRIRIAFNDPWPGDGFQAGYWVYQTAPNLPEPLLFHQAARA